MRSTHPLALVAALAAVAGLTVSATAGEMKGEGTASYIMHRIAATRLADGRTLSQAHLKGVILAADPAWPFNLSSEDCNDTSLVDHDGKLLKEYGECVAVDKAGDVLWLKYDGSDAGSTWQVIGGTGKYDGSTGGGTTKNLLATRDGRLAISWTADVKTK